MTNAAIRTCFRDPIPEIAEAARILDEAASAHMRGDSTTAERLIGLTNTSVLREYIDSLWGAGSPYVRPRALSEPPMKLAKTPSRMPSKAEKHALHQRDGFHCRFCGVPVIRVEVRKVLMAAYPAALPWGKKNVEQHAAFQVLWAQYDHVVPHAHGGLNALDNMVIACAGCNFGKVHYTLEQLGLSDPRLREPVSSTWDGLERVLGSSRLTFS